jgi:EAL domain-containing protein (putative c-di-GMP-specific phosphodiesterase class I)
MYDAKKAGRDRFVYSARPTQKPDSSPTARHVEHARVCETFEANRLCLYGQPIVDLETGETAQYELLLRVQGPSGGPPLPPAAFLGTAERVGMIQSIDGWVVREAVRLLAASSEHRTTLNVNVSGRSIGSPEFAALVEAVLDQHGVDPSRLVFELTETAAISDIEQAKAFAMRMREMGCQIALDDFGAGFGSFQYLKHLPFDLLKISGEFVRDLTAGTIDQVVVKAIVGISREMRKRTVAEFVESAEMATFLRDNGVDCGQGYYLGAPQPVTDLLQAAATA